MNDVIEFYRMLAGKVREEMPGLHMVMLLFDTPSWRRGRNQTIQFMEKQFGDNAETITKSMRDAHVPTEAAVSCKYFHRIVDGDETTMVFQVNVDQAHFKNSDDVAVAVKGIITHELGHVVSSWKDTRTFSLRDPHYWTLCHEEGFCDLFNAAVMANDGHAENLEIIMRYRLHSHFEPSAFAISSTEHCLPALVEPAKRLMDEFGARAKGDFSIGELKGKAERIVLQNDSLLKRWRHFASAAMYLRSCGYKAEDVLSLARQSDCAPFVDVVETYTPFRAATKPRREPYVNPFDPRHFDEYPKRRILTGFHGQDFDAAPRFGHVVMHDTDIVFDMRICTL